MNLYAATIFWRPQLGAVGGGVLMLLLAGWTLLTYRRSLKRHSHGRALLLLAPKLVILLLLLLALFDPLWGIEQAATGKPSVIAVLDASASMDVRDRDETSRAVRAKRIVSDMEAELSGDLGFEFLEFDTSLREMTARASSTNTARGTDVGACLLALSKRAGLSESAGILLLTDGGDDAIQPARIPEIPLWVVGVGSEPSAWNDARIADLDVPETVEHDTMFEVLVDIEVGGDQEFAQSLDAVDIALEEITGETRATLESSRLPVTGTRLRHTFRVHAGPTPGVRRFRAAIQPIHGEISPLNNRREFAVNVTKKSLNVLLFSNTLSWDISFLRETLDADKGINLVALTRVTDDRYFLQGDIDAADRNMEAGFPSQASSLTRYQCIILGSFPLTDLSSRQRRALMQYVDDGGSLILLGGERSFAMGDGIAADLSPLFPWRVPEGGPELVSGAFPVSPAPGALGNPLVDRAMEGLTASTRLDLRALNVVGNVKPGAAVLFEASYEGRTLPVIAIQAYGKGAVLGIASNTLWLWHRAGSNRRRIYELLWRQAVRYIAGMVEGGRFLTVKWDRQTYRPGEEAEVSLRVTCRHAPGQLRVEGSMETGKGRDQLLVRPDTSADQQYTCRIVFPERAEYHVSFLAFAGRTLLEKYDKVLAVGSLYNEGSSLGLDQAFLRQLAVRPSDRCVTEENAAELTETIGSRAVSVTDYRSVPVIEVMGLYPALLLIALLVEWIIRRRFNLF